MDDNATVLGRMPEKFSPPGENFSEQENAAGMPDEGKHTGTEGRDRRAPKLTALEREIGSDTAKFFKEATDACLAEAANVSDMETRGNAQLYRYLDRCFEFVRHERFDLGKFAKYCQRNKLPCTKATRKNACLCAIRATSRGINNKLASKYAKALQSVPLDLPADGGLAEFLLENGGVEGCLKREREDRRVRNGAQTRGAIRRLAITGVPEGLSGTVPLIVRIAQGKGEFVRLGSLEPEEFVHAASGIPESPTTPSDPDNQGGDVTVVHDQARDGVEEVPAES